MEKFRKYEVGLGGLKIGTHEFDFEVDNGFFSLFEFSLIKAGTVRVNISLEKQSNVAYVLDLTLEGVLDLECDRCQQDVHLPIYNSDSTVLKLSNEQDVEVEGIWFLPIDTTSVNLANLIYENISVCKPLKTVCTMVANNKCDQEQEKLLNKLKPGKTKVEKENPVWDQLKNLKFEQ